MHAICFVVPFALVFLADNSKAFVDLSFSRKPSRVTAATAAAENVTKQYQPQQPSWRQGARGMKTSMQGSLRAGDSKDPASGVPRLVVMDLDYTLW